MGKGIRINEVYKPLYTSKCRYVLLTGGRGSLKSTTVHDFISRLTYERGHGILVTRYTMASAHKSIIPEFLIVAERNGSIKDFDVTKEKITNKLTGSFILFSGIKTSSGDQTANLKSIAGITTWVIDEGEDFRSEKTFDDIDNSVRSNIHQNRIIWIQNPSTKEHFIYKRWIENNNKKVDVKGFDVTMSNEPDVEHIHTTYHIAKEYLSESFIHKAEKIKETNPKKYYHTYIGGWLEKEDGVIFENWSEGMFDTSLPFAFGMDFGFYPDPTALVKVAVNESLKTIYVSEELYDYKLGVEELTELVKDKVKGGLLVTDTNEARTIAYLRRNGVNLREAKKGAGSIIEGIRQLQDYSIVVTAESSNLKKELNNYVWNDKKSSIPIDSYNHAIDSLRYAVSELINKPKSMYVR